MPWAVRGKKTTRWVGSANAAASLRKAKRPETADTRKTNTKKQFSSEDGIIMCGLRIGTVVWFSQPSDSIDLGPCCEFACDPQRVSDPTHAWMTNA